MEQLAAGSFTVDPSDAAATFTVLFSEGCSLKRTGPGVVEVTLNQATQDERFDAQATIAIQPTQGVTIGVTSDPTDFTKKTIYTTLGNGAPVDVSLRFVFQRFTGKINGSCC
jgi:hypothetical protein